MSDRSADRFRLFAACSAAVAVMAGAFGSHALRARLEPRLLEVFETAARYQMYHALALLAVAILLGSRAARADAEASSVSARADRPRRLLVTSGWAFIVGTVLFSGSLYALALTDLRILGAVTPVGGVGFLVGWGCLAMAARVASGAAGRVEAPR